jgi:hypothetical protein
MRRPYMQQRAQIHLEESSYVADIRLVQVIIRKWKIPNGRDAMVSVLLFRFDTF